MAKGSLAEATPTQVVARDGEKQVSLWEGGCVNCVMSRGGRSYRAVTAPANGNAAPGKPASIQQQQHHHNNNKKTSQVSGEKFFFPEPEEV